MWRIRVEEEGEAHAPKHYDTEGCGAQAELWRRGRHCQDACGEGTNQLGTCCHPRCRGPAPPRVMGEVLLRGLPSAAAGILLWTRTRPGTVKVVEERPGECGFRSNNGWQ